jgi:hypothetical protein
MTFRFISLGNLSVSNVKIVGVYSKSLSCSSRSIGTAIDERKMERQPLKCLQARSKGS